MDANLTFYRLDNSLKNEMTNTDLEIANYSFGKPGRLQQGLNYVTRNQRQEKVLLIVGATGAGKSTLINGIVNYLFGVDWEDDFRFKLILDETTKSQAHSQTSWITAYTFHWQEGFPFPYTLTIIDTPGFGDTRGIERDHKIVAQIKNLFELEKEKGGIDTLHGVGFVTPATSTRLTPTQRYIFDSILAVFGKDVANNITVMATFADGGAPPVLAAIKEANVPHNGCFKFNNSALFTDSRDTFAKMFWQMGTESFEGFFNFFSGANETSLQLTREVLREREQLESSVTSLQSQIKLGLSKMNSLQEEEEVMRTNEAKIKNNEDFTFVVNTPEIQEIKLPDNQHVTNCLECNFTCHFPCYINDSGRKYNCAAMSGNESNAHCRNCPNKCHWERHRNNKFRFEVTTVPKVRSYEEVKQRYEEGLQGKHDAEAVIAQMKKEIDQISNTLVHNIQQVNKCLRRLDDIALKPDPVTDAQYIELLIESERQEAKLGFQQRITGLEIARDKAQLVGISKEIQQKKGTEESVLQLVANKRELERKKRLSNK